MFEWVFICYIILYNFIYIINYICKNIHSEYVVDKIPFAKGKDRTSKDKIYFLERWKWKTIISSLIVVDLLESYIFHSEKIKV